MIASNRNHVDEEYLNTNRHDFFANTSNVLLIHGLGGGAWMMRRLGRHLNQYSFQPKYWRYSSLIKGIPEHAQRLRNFLLQLLRENRFVYVVAHSLGAILFRAATYDLAELDRFRVVMLAPPNRGSEVATLLAKRIGFLCPVLSQLSADEGSYVRTLPKRVPRQTGIIAAAQDNVVALKDVWLDDVHERAIVDCRHGMLPFDQKACSLVGKFLRYGSFSANEYRE